MAIIEDEFPLNIKPITIFESLLQQDNLTIELDNDIAITYSGKKDDDEINYKIKNILIQSENDKNIDFSSILEQKELNKKKKENDSNNENEDNFNNENDEIDENNENDKNNKNDENDEFKQSNIFSIKYKDIYIGGISPNFQMREGFGLNKYDEDHSLYIGLWKNNMKEGFGFLKVNDDTYYIGNFHQNQLEGECILYLKSKNILYLGTFTKGSFEEGVYIDVNNDIFYRGKFINNKKNDDFCTMIEMNNRHIFVGKVDNDNFKEGYLCLYKIEEKEVKDENGDDATQIILGIEKIFYYYKNKDNNNKFIYKFENNFKEVLQQDLNVIFALEFKTKGQVEKMFEYFDYLDILGEDADYNNLNKYNEKNDESLFYIFINNYNSYMIEYKEFIEKFDINKIKKELDISQDIQEQKDEYE